MAPTAYLDVDGHLVTKENGSVEPNALRGWVDEAREVTYAASRGRVADQQIGQILAFSSKGPDGAWPDIAVRDLIEDLGAEDVDNGIEIGVRNKRGVFSKSPNEGGKQEWQLANTYKGYANALTDRWPQTAAMLQRISDIYASEARREDIRAELSEDLWR